MQRMTAGARPRLFAQVNTDLLAMTAIVAGFLLFLLIFPFAHDFSFIDDWCYYQASDRIAGGQGFAPPQCAQVNLVSQAYWGALFIKLLGSSFTAVTAATLSLALVALLVCYTLLRQLDFRPGLSLLGVACLSCNYIFVTYSYSFHSDVNFLALLLLAVVCFHEGLRRSEQSGRRIEAWLLLGSVFAALAFLTRQYGAVVPVAAFAWLLFAGRMTWRRVAAVLVVPLLAAGSYYLWRGGFPLTHGGSLERAALDNLLKDYTVLFKRLNNFSFAAAPALGLAVPLLGWLRYWWLWGSLALVAGYFTFSRQQDLLRGLAATNVPARQSEYLSQPQAAEQTPLWWLGAAMTVWLVGAIVEEHGLRVWKLLRGKRNWQGGDFCLLVFLGLFLPMLAISMTFFERYWLTTLPFFIAAALSRFRAPQPRIALLLPLLLLLMGLGHSVLRHLDDYDYNSVRWQAARELVATGMPLDKIEAGFAWDGYYMFNEGIRRLGSSDVRVIGYVFPHLRAIDPQYVVANHPLRGYRTLRSYPYFSRLTCWCEQPLRVQQREVQP